MSKDKPIHMPYGAYYKTEIPAHDPELTQHGSRYADG